MRTTKSQFYFFSIGGIKIPAVLIFIFFFAATAFAQPHVQSPADRARIDSIFRAIDAMPQDTATVSYINHVYNDYLWQFNLPEAYGRLKYAVRLSGKLNYDKGEYVSYSNMAGFSMRLGNNYIELQNRLKALDAARRMNDSVRIVSQWFGIGVAYHGMGKDSLALLYELDALRKFRQMVDTTTEQGKDRMSRTYLFIAWTYQSCGQYASALP
ncbi:MAG TPA: hypothetical protein VFU15_03635, partial [Bacteroidia bacterium]|nr:hypothetical protein [Bacteroidia bacterium]